jgi:hypothetical protein
LASLGPEQDAKPKIKTQAAIPAPIQRKIILLSIIPILQKQMFFLLNHDTTNPQMILKNFTILFNTQVSIIYAVL